MLPATPTADAVNIPMANAIACGEDMNRLGRGANFSYGSLCQDGLSTSLPASATALSHHVGHVFRAASKKQMVRPHATPVIAYMQDAKVVRNFAVMNDPRRSGRGKRPSTAADVYLAVSVGGYVPGPQPAAIGLFDLGPEPISQRNAMLPSSSRHTRIISNGL